MVGKINFQNLCIKWVEHVRAGDKYQKYKHIEMEILNDCPKFGLNPDEVFDNLHLFAMSGEEIEVVY